MDFSRLDANSDGFIDKREAARMRGLSNTFSKADSNRDGKLDQTEFSAAQSMMK
jgi:Ca2+-binding EF-hand superfamily protein